MWEMGIRFLILAAIWNCAVAWSNLDCPAPRSPDNGLNFIFQDGARVEFRCHPGYRMYGYASATCVDQKWNNPPPECKPIRKGALPVNDTSNRELYEVPLKKDTPKQESRELFSWGSVYGDGPRRLPLINGIWPTQEEADKMLALGPQSTPGPRTMVADEIDIAELRQKQLEELRNQRTKSSKNKGKKRGNGSRRKNKNKGGLRVEKDNQTSTVLSLGETSEGPSIAVSKVNHRRHHHRHRQSRLRPGRNNKHHSVNDNKHHSVNDFVSNRKSRVDTGSISPHNSRSMFKRKFPEFRRRPMQEITYEELKMIERQTYDATCVEEVYNRKHVPSMAPDIRKAFVFRYETKKNGTLSYMVARYKCMNGFHFRDHRVDRLFCQHKNWIGELPKCISNNMRG